MKKNMDATVNENELVCENRTLYCVILLMEIHCQTNFKVIIIVRLHFRRIIASGEFATTYYISSLHCILLIFNNPQYNVFLILLKSIFDVAILLMPCPLMYSNSWQQHNKYVNFYSCRMFNVKYIVRYMLYFCVKN